MFVLHYFVVADMRIKPAALPHIFVAYDDAYIDSEWNVKSVNMTCQCSMSCVCSIMRWSSPLPVCIPLKMSFKSRCTFN